MQTMINLHRILFIFMLAITNGTKNNNKKSSLVPTTVVGQSRLFSLLLLGTLCNTSDNNSTQYLLISTIVFKRFSFLLHFLRDWRAHDFESNIFSFRLFYHFFFLSRNCLFVTIVVDSSELFISLVSFVSILFNTIQLFFSTCFFQFQLSQLLSQSNHTCRQTLWMTRSNTQNCSLKFNKRHTFDIMLLDGHRFQLQCFKLTSIVKMKCHVEN